MKLTKSQLKQLIKEELQQLLYEGDFGRADHCAQQNLKSALYKINNNCDGATVQINTKRGKGRTVHTITVTPKLSTPLSRRHRLNSEGTK